MSFIIESIGAFVRTVSARLSPRLGITLGITAVVFLMLYGFFIAAPIQFPEGKVISIKKGSSLTEIAETLHQGDVIRSPLLFLAIIEFIGRGDTIQAGAYVFPYQASVFGVVDMLLSPESRIDPTRVTFPEGATAREMAILLEDAIPGFDGKKFQELATPHEGFLFPDTYLIAPDTTPVEVVALLRETFDKRIAELEPELTRFGKPLHEVIVMASLIEREARTIEVRRTISGILWRRIELGMPLQVDAVFGYIQGRATFHPKYSDLAVDSPYNTYMHKGLPPGAIANPGIEAIRAAATPIRTKYLFYLSDAAGRIHYAADFDGHIENRRKYQ